MNKLLKQYQKGGLNIQSTFFAADLLGFFRRQNGVFYWTSKFYRRTMRIQMTASIFLLTLSETFLVCSDFTTPEVTTLNLRDLCKVSIKHQMFKFRLNRQNLNFWAELLQCFEKKLRVSFKEEEREVKRLPSNLSWDEFIRAQSTERLRSCIEYTSHFSITSLQIPHGGGMGKCSKFYALFLYFFLLSICRFFSCETK